jgi:hypothetical protein
MAITAVALSDTEIQIENVVFTFEDVEQTRAFEACLATSSIATCLDMHPPKDRRAIEMDGHRSGTPDEEERGSTISPSLGGDAMM